MGIRPVLFIAQCPCRSFLSGASLLLAHAPPSGREATNRVYSHDRLPVLRLQHRRACLVKGLRAWMQERRCEGGAFAAASRGGWSSCCALSVPSARRRPCAPTMTHHRRVAGRIGRRPFNGREAPPSWASPRQILFSKASRGPKARTGATPIRGIGAQTARIRLARSAVSNRRSIWPAQSGLRSSRRPCRGSLKHSASSTTGTRSRRTPLPAASPRRRGANTSCSNSISTARANNADDSFRSKSLRSAAGGRPAWSRPKEPGRRAPRWSWT